MHRWWVFLHIAGVFGFLMSHGVSAYATFQVGRERDPVRVKQLLELSSSSVGIMWNSMGVLLLGGIAAGFTGGFWGQGWIWASIVVLTATIAGMYALATGWASRLRTIAAAMAEGTEAVSQAQFAETLGSKRPYTIAGVGFLGLFVILWLMIFKPTLGFGGVPDCGLVTGAETICAFDDQRFVPARLTVGAGSETDLVFQNEDDGVPHNVAIYRDDSAEESLFVGDLVEGPATVTYVVPATLDPGVYHFRCDVHPIMNGTLEVA